MPRKKFRRRDQPQPDSLYNSVLITRLINKMSYIGKKTKATGILYDAFEKIRESLKEEPPKVLERAIENTRPLLETRPRQVGGATYQVPMEVPVYRSESRAMRWILEFARAKKGSPMHVRLAEEIMQASRREGAAFKKREETHRMAEANRAFAHYRW